MILEINSEKLNELIKSFYSLTGIKVAVYNTKNEEIFAYPPENCRFCSLMQNGAEELCCKSTKELCDRCAESCGLTVHKCHAGLTEVAAPLTNGITVIGYIMFGQITNEKNREKFMEDVEKRCREYFDDCTEIMGYAKEIPYFSDEHIKSVSDITNAIASYIIMSHLIYETEKPLIYKINEYINSNLEKDLSVDSLCREFYLSKSELYKITKPYMPEGIASYVKSLRIRKAAELLGIQGKTIAEAAEKTGFSDINYFRRIFKSEMGISAPKYRQKFNELPRA